MRKPSRQTVITALVAVTGLTIGGLSSSAALDDAPPPTAAPGSLPLQGDELIAGDGGDPDAAKTGFASQWNVLNWAPGPLAAVVSSFSMNQVNDEGRTVKRMLVGTQANADVGAADSENNLSYSDDSGKSFLTTNPDADTSALNVVRLADGSLLAIDFLPGWADDAHTKFFVNVYRSTDAGTTWKHRQAPTTFPADKIPSFQTWGGFRVHKRILLLGDGTLIVPGYTVFKGRWMSFVLQSTDNGDSWSYRSEIPNTDSPGTNEVGWAYTSDGRLTAVMRSNDTPEHHLMQSFSDDDGKTWTEAKDIIGPDGEVVRGLYPDLVLQPNGTMLLLTGRRDVRVLANYDGTARTWDTANTIFANFPSDTSNGRYDGSSGNSSMESVGASRSVVFFDQCHVWGCGAYNQQFGVSAKYAAAVTAGTGRIDVTTKLLDGTATLAGTFAPTPAKFPEQRPEGAFDGSSERHAEAVLDGPRGRPGTMTLTLGRAYVLNKIGLMLGHGEVAESGTVAVSSDGKKWTTVIEAGDRLDRAMRYTEFAPTTAKYVRVTGDRETRTTVTELELYAAGVETFENEIPFSVPRGWTSANAAWTTDVPNNVAYSDVGGHHSATALRLWDKWTDDNARINRPSEPADRQFATMQWTTSDTRARFSFGALGQADDGSAVKAWNFRLTAQGGQPPTLEVSDGSKWTAVGKLSKSLTMRAYLPLTIDTTADRATVKIGGDSFTTTVKAAKSGKQMGLHFSTGDPAGYGGIYYLDDVSVSNDPGAEPTLESLDVDPTAVAAGEPFTVSTTVTNSGDKPATDMSATLTAPDGWQVQPRDNPTEVPAESSVAVSWTVTAPAETTTGLYSLQANVNYLSGGVSLTGQSDVFQVGIGVQPAGIRTFDDEATGQPPAHTETVGTVTVEEVTAGTANTRAVRVNDNSASVLSRAVFLQGSAPSRRFEFDLLPRAASQATIVAVKGTGDSAHGVWRFLISPESPTSSTGIVNVFNGTAWVRLGTIAGLHDRNSWSRVVIDATTTTVTFTANGTDLTTTTRASGASSITSLEVSSSGTGSIGTDTYLDDLEMIATG